jgi:hypothetical protein
LRPTFVLNGLRSAYVDRRIVGATLAGSVCAVRCSRPPRTRILSKHFHLAAVLQGALVLQKGQITERIHIQRSIFPLLIVLACVSAAIAQKAPPAKPFERFDGCVLEPDQWTDGDSFRVQLPDGHYETFRLYFVDTTESRSSGQRSDEQAAYFGLTRAQAIDLGRQGQDIHGKRSRTTVHDLHTLAERFWSSLLCNRRNLRRS